MMLQRKTLRFLHISIGIITSLIIAFFYIYFSKVFNTNTSQMEVLLFLLLILSLFCCSGYLNDKIIINVVKKIALFLHDAPDRNTIVTSIVIEIIEERRLGFLGLFYKNILFHKIIKNKNDLFSLKKTIKTSDKFKAQWHGLGLVFPLIMLHFLWNSFMDLPLEFRLLLSLPMLAIISYSAFTRYDYPFRIQAKYAKKYNIKDWK